MNQSIEDLQPHQEWGDDSSSHFFDTTHSTTLSTAIIEDTKAERRCFREDRKLDKYHHPQREARRSFFDR